MECVYDCSHPLWGGAGVCIKDDDDAAIEDACVCDVGYVPRDSFGNPSCVPKQALIVIYMVVAATAASASLFALWHLAEHRKMSSIARATRKAASRRRMMIAFSFSQGAMALSFCVAAARGGAASLWGGGMFYVIYMAGISPNFMCAASSSELWLETLPPQLLTPGGFLAGLRRLAVEQDFFLRVGFAGVGFSASLAALALVFGQRLIRSSIHLAIIGGCISLVLGVTTGAIILIRAINTSSEQAPLAWHGRARRQIRVHAGVVGLTCVLGTIDLVVLELTKAGRQTPIIPFSVAVVIGAVGMAAPIHFTKPVTAGTQSALAPPTPSAVGSLSLWSFPARKSPRLSPVLPNNCIPGGGGGGGGGGHIGAARGSADEHGPQEVPLCKRPDPRSKKVVPVSADMA